MLGARPLQVEGPDPEQRAVGPVGERLLVDVERDQRHPAETVGTAHDQRQVRHHAQDLPAALVQLFELGDHHRGRAGRSDRLVRAREGIERLERRHFHLPAGRARQDRPEDAVAHRLPVGTDGDDQMAAARDPVDQRLSAQRVERHDRLAVGGIEDDGLAPRRSHTSGRASTPVCGSIRAVTISAASVAPERPDPSLESRATR